MHPLSNQATLPADDIIWSKPSRPVSGPIPIPPRNEPHLSNSTVEIPYSMGPLLASEANCTYGEKCEDSVSLVSDSDLLPTIIKFLNQCFFQREITTTFSPFGIGFERAGPPDEDNMSTGYANPPGDQPQAKPLGSTGRPGHLLPKADRSTSVSTVSQICLPGASGFQR